MLYLDKTDPREDVACRTEGIGDISLLTHRPATRTAIQPGKQGHVSVFSDDHKEGEAYPRTHRC